MLHKIKDVQAPNGQGDGITLQSFVPVEAVVEPVVGELVEPSKRPA
jgi:hypothetical protein